MLRGRPRKSAPDAALQPDLSTTTTMPTRRKSSRLSETKNSSAPTSDIEVAEATVERQPSGKRISRSRRVFSRVEIPPASKASKSPSTASSAFAASRDVSMGFDTPATSTTQTPPALSLAVMNRFSELAQGTDRKGKRKRTVEDDLLEQQVLEDEQLAQALQEQEYGDGNDAAPVKGPSGPRRDRVLVDDSDDDELTEPPSDDGSEGDASFGDESEDSHPTANKRETSKANASRLHKGRGPRKAPEVDEFVVHDDDGSPASDFEDEEVLTEETDSSEPLVKKRRFVLEHREAVKRRNRNKKALARAGKVHVSEAATARGGHILAPYVPKKSGESRADWDYRKLQAAHPELATLWDDLDKVPKITPVAGQQPAEITRTLKQFQLEGVDWMKKQEKSKWGGGLLGDEMGMGKTIQAVSLIMSDWPSQKPSLVVVPPVALLQWQAEIKAYTNGKLNVLVHHNTDPKVKKLKKKDLEKYDVIMISYSGLESIYRKQSKGWKRDDVLVKENSRIHEIHYHRVILDEAHSIKSRSTGVAKACFALKADTRWCLSGTPVQNRIGEFFSLLRFLQVTPFACYFCRTCSCSELHWAQDEEKKCLHCGHSGFNHVSIFNQELLAPITQIGDSELRREGLRKLRLLTDRLMLRRLKRDHTSSMELPPKDVTIHNEFFGEIERDFSNSIMGTNTRKFDNYVARGVMLNNVANIFGLLMNMRQVANHPDLILKRHADGNQNVLICCICDEVAEEPIRSKCKHEFCRKCVRDFIAFNESSSEGPDCPRCHAPLSIDFDQPEIEQDEEAVQKNSIINRIKTEGWTSSTKIEMLIYDLYKLRSKKQTQKSIIFSQFTSMLHLLRLRLHRAGFSTVMLDGSMSPIQRQRSIEYFMNNTDVECFLISLKAGGVALNLTEASRVFIVDPWWNPAAEWQSADRCHRIGQKRPVVITRLVIEDSVESRMVMLQEKKANMISGTINNDDVAMDKLSPEDLNFLFRGS